MLDPTPTQSANILAPDYLARSGNDVMFDTDGTLLPEWMSLLEKFGNLGNLRSLRNDSARLLRENGLGFRPGNPELEQRWALDPMPFLITANNWRQLSAGLEQRARLMEALLDDLYGAREVIRQQLIPARLLYTYPGFLRACEPLPGAAPRQLTSYSADLVLGEDGRSYVAADRTDRPTGVGITLETRVILARILPAIVTESRVLRLAPFFARLRDALIAMAPTQKVRPRIVLLASSAQSVDFFDHAFLASYLGYSLLQGEDLTVRQGRVYMRTVEGLKLVDVVLRRLEDTLCDPLELSSSSIDGVPGLLEAERRGHVWLSNPIGAGILENPALLAYLPRICRALLGEELALPSQPTWWCGDPQGCNEVLDRFDSMVIRTLSTAPSIKVSSLPRAERETLRRQIIDSPSDYVAQLEVKGATVPCFEQDKLIPKRIITRCFVARASDGFHTLPGGLSRPLERDQSVTPLRDIAGGVFKDTWVLAGDEELPAGQLVSPTTPVRLRTADESLPSRAAERLYEVGALAEQTACVVRAARTLIDRAREAREYSDPIESASTARFKELLGWLLDTKTEQIPLGQLLLRATYDTDLTTSAHARVNHMLRAAYGVRHRWSADCWRILDDIVEIMENDSLSAHRSLDALETVYDQLLTALDAFSGFTMESMTQEHGWHFLLIGRRFARADWMSRLLRGALVQDPSEPPAPFLEGLLHASESLLTHRRRYLSYVSARTVAETLLLAANNPRAIKYQIDSLRQHIDLLPVPDLGNEFALPHRAMLELSTRLELADSDLTADNPTDLARNLGEVLSETERLIQAARDGLNLTYFAHATRPRQLRANDIVAPKPGAQQ